MTTAIAWIHANSSFIWQILQNDLTGGAAITWLSLVLQYRYRKHAELTR